MLGILQQEAETLSFGMLAGVVSESEFINVHLNMLCVR